jgi:hypothetical protein
LPRDGSVRVLAASKALIRLAVLATFSRNAGEGFA